MPPPNPYIAGPPVGGDSGFFGREDILAAVEQLLRYPTHNSVILYGQRQIGKTSLLLQLERHLPNPPFFTVYFDLADHGMKPVGQLLYEISVVAANKAKFPLPEQELFKDNPDAFHLEFLPALYQAMGHKIQPVFLLDEFHSINIPEANLPKTAAIRNLDTYLYKLLSTQTHTDFIFAAGRRMSELDTVTQSSYQANLSRFVSVLSPGEARQIILQKGAPTYDEAAVRRVINFTRGHPYLTQLVCHTLFKRVILQLPDNPHVTINDVEAILSTLAENHDEGLVTLWNSIPAAEQLTLAAIAEKGVSFSRAAISSSLNQAGIPPDTPGLDSALKNLVNWQMLEQTEGGYTFFIEFLRYWIARSYPLEQITQTKLAELDPRVAALYQAARQAHLQEKSAQAIEKLRQALSINPNYLPACMLLGQLLAKKKQPVKAVEAYEKAYKLNPMAAGGVLASALLALGQMYQKKGDYAQALAAYNRAVAVAPQNKTVSAQRDALQAKLSKPDIPTQSAPEPYQKEQSRRRKLWLAPLAAIFLLLLLLLCMWAYNPLGPLSVKPTSTILVQITSPPKDGKIVTVATATATATDTPQPPPPTPSREPTRPTATFTPQPTQTRLQSSSTPTAQVPSVTATSTIPATAVPEDGFQFSQINVAGSTAMQPLLEKIAQAFTAREPNVKIVVEGGSSNTGLKDLLQGNIDVAMVSRDLNIAELSNLGNIQVFTLPQQDVIAIVTHPILPINNLSREQIQSIFSGATTNWNEAGGPDADIVLVSREEGADTRISFEQQVMGNTSPITTTNLVTVLSDQEVVDTVTGRPYSIGYITVKDTNLNTPPFPILSENWAVIDTMLLAANPLMVDQAAPTAKNVLDGSYPMARPLNLLAPDNPNPSIQAWIDFIYSPEGQRVMENFRQDNP